MKDYRDLIGHDLFMELVFSIGQPINATTTQRDSMSAFFCIAIPSTQIL